MAFRDELGAAHARINDLEGELARANQQISELKQGEREQRQQGASDSAPLLKPTRRAAGGIAYRPPWSYFPLWVRLGIGLRFALRFRLHLPETDNVLRWLFLQMALPLYYLAALPFFFLVLLPYFALICLVTTPFVALIKVLSGLQFDRGQQLQPQLPPDLSETEVAMIIFVVFMATAPLSIPIMLGLLQR